MIVIKTKMKDIPTSCTKCKLYDWEYNGGFYQSSKKCSILKKEPPYVFDKEKHVWRITKCKNCPLLEI